MMFNVGDLVVHKCSKEIGIVVLMSEEESYYLVNTGFGKQSSAVDCELEKYHGSAVGGSDALLEGLNISIRLRKACNKWGVKTVGELAAVPEDVLDTQKGVGPRTLGEIRELVRAHGLFYL